MMCWTAFALASSLLALPALAQEAGDGDLQQEARGAGDSAEEETTGLTLAQRIRAVSRPVFSKEGRFELTPVFGVSISDAFYRRWTVGARASYHLFENFSLEVGGAWNAWSEPTQSAIFLGGVQPVIEDVAPLLGYADVGITFSPIYGKVALMSEWIIHFDTYVSTGGGIVLDGGPGLVRPALQLGGGARIFLLPWLSVQAELRDYFYPAAFDDFRIRSLLLMNVGVGVYFPFDLGARTAG
jgi:outer membrane beta-barrel protein